MGGGPDALNRADGPPSVLARVINTHFKNFPGGIVWRMFRTFHKPYNDTHLERKLWTTD